MITAEIVKSVLDYDPSTGTFIWRSVRPGRAKSGDRAGWVFKRTDRLSYLVINVHGRNYRAHRLAWLYVHGEWPPGLLDHVNGDGLDNRIDNLRPATVSENAANRRVRRDSSTGAKGVIWYARTRRWQARITVKGKEKHLGYFTRFEDASDAYQRAAVQHFGEFANSGAGQ